MARPWRAASGQINDGGDGNADVARRDDGGEFAARTKRREAQGRQALVGLSSHVR